MTFSGEKGGKYATQYECSTCVTDNQTDGRTGDKLTYSSLWHILAYMLSRAKND